MKIGQEPEKPEHYQDHETSCDHPDYHAPGYRNYGNTGKDGCGQRTGTLRTYHFLSPTL